MESTFELAHTSDSIFDKSILKFKLYRIKGYLEAKRDNLKEAIQMYKVCDELSQELLRENLEEVVYMWKEFAQLYMRALNFDATDELLRRYLNRIATITGSQSKETLQAKKELA